MFCINLNNTVFTIVNNSCDHFQVFFFQLKQFNITNSFKWHHKNLMQLHVLIIKEF